MLWIVLLSTLFLANICSAQDRPFILNLEKCEVVWYDKEYMKDVEIDCKLLNESALEFQFSGKGELLKEVNMDQSSGTGRIFVHDGTKFVAKPQLKLTVPICDEYKAETFGYWQEIEEHGNLKGCGVHKPGHYEVKDFVPRLKIGNFPIAAPAGKYKLNIMGHLNNMDMAEMNVFVSIVTI